MMYQYLINAANFAVSLNVSVNVLTLISRSYNTCNREDIKNQCLLMLIYGRLYISCYRELMCAHTANIHCRYMITLKGNFQKHV